MIIGICLSDLILQDVCIESFIEPLKFTFMNVIKNYLITGTRQQVKNELAFKNTLKDSPEGNNQEPRRKTKKKKQFRCPTPGCQHSYSRKETLKYHLKWGCLSEFEIKCAYCRYLTTYPSNIHSHCRSQHPTRKIAFVNLREIVKSDD